MEKKDMVKKLLILIGGIIIVLIIFVIIANVLRSINKDSYALDSLRKDSKIAAEKYYSDLETKLVSGESIVVDIKDLVSKEYLNDYSEKLEEGIVCNGNVTIRNNFDNIIYTVNLDCGEKLKDQTLGDYIKNNESVVTSGDGLYEVDNSLVYRGEFVNNYVEFAGQTWYILRINSDNSVKLIQGTSSMDKLVWDDRYNTDKKTNSGINDYFKSRIKDTIDLAATEENVIKNSKKGYIMPQDICVGSRNESSTNKNESEECSVKDNSKMFGLIQVNEYLLASIDSACSGIDQNQCENYNYIYNRFDKKMWTLNKVSDSSYLVYNINGVASTSRAATSGYLYMTVKLSPEVIYKSGDGTKENPYIIMEA